jgi:hypothetical protein
MEWSVLINIGAGYEDDELCIIKLMDCKGIELSAVYFYSGFITPRSMP